MFRTYKYYSINQIFTNGLRYHVIHYQTIDNSNLYLLLCETLCLLRVFCGYIHSDLDFYHNVSKGFTKTTKIVCVCILTS